MEARLRKLLKIICSGAQSDDDFVITRGWLLMQATLCGLDIERDIMTVTDEDVRKELEDDFDDLLF